MSLNPGHYVAVVVTSQSENGLPMKQLKLLRPDDPLVIGKVYRLIRFEGNLMEFMYDSTMIYQSTRYDISKLCDRFIFFRCVERICREEVRETREVVAGKRSARVGEERPRRSSDEGTKCKCKGNQTFRRPPQML
uniref:Uncharacterized protein n=1 Tax=Lactuca sativa TaxID=4236 RepID=A0A9R1WC99_LACSA|nr:hypothetical protein LSAT_V11C200080220 [Lactuca sativa]